MKKVSVAILKENLSHYLREVKAGEEVIVTSHQQPVAKVVSYDNGDLPLTMPSRSVKDLAKIRGVRPSSGKSALDILQEDRERR